MALFAQNHIAPGPIGGPSTLPEEHREETYNEAFPSLGGGGGLMMNARQSQGTAVTKTDILEISMVERKFDDSQSERLYSIVKDIQDRSGAKLNVSSAKDQSLTLVITGRPESNAVARKLINSNLMKEASLSLNVPKEFHRFILGAKGKTLTGIENETGTRITLPKADASQNDGIAITGGKEGLHVAARKIKAIVEEHAKTDRKIVKIPQQFHDLMPIQELINLYGGSADQPQVKVHVPPKTGKSDRPDEIVVTGDREAVGKVASDLEDLYKTKERSCKTLNLTIAKQKHKYIIGPKGVAIQEIFAATGVSIKVPPQDSDSDQVTLFGESEKIGNAVSLVLQKADSSNRVEVSTPTWLQRYLRGTIDKLKEEFPKVYIDFSATPDKITLEGPTADVDKVEKVFKEATADLLKRLKFAELQVNPKYFRHLIGAGGKQITQLRNETKVNIQFPEEKAEKRTDIIRIEGERQQVDIASKTLSDIVHRLEMEKSKELTIEKRYHRFMIGKKGKLVEQYRDVYISFPRQEEKSDIVEVRGNKNDVETVAAALKKLYEEVKIENHEVGVSVMKKFHKHLIGKQGSNIAKIREQTHVEIDLPPLNSDSQKVIVRGRKENVDKAVAIIEENQRNFENSAEFNVDIARKFHEALIGPRGAGVKAIEQMYENVIIRFPGDKDKASSIIRVLGPKEDAEAARKMLLERANDVKETSFSEELRVKPEFHRYLIGRKGAKVREIYEETKARVVFPDSHASNEDADAVVIIGRESEVKAARKKIETLVQRLEETKEQTVQVEPKYHKHFVERKGFIVNKIASECGGVTISFPRQGVNSSDVVVKGPKECVPDAVARILEEIEKYKRIITIEVEIAAKHRRHLLGRRQRVHDIMKEYEVDIVFPPSTVGRNEDSRENSSPDDSSLTTPEGTVSAEANGSPSSTESAPEPMMTVKVIGLDDNCVAARDALVACIPVTEELEVPQEYHRSLIGQGGQAVRELSDQFDVRVDFPNPKTTCDIIKISGTAVAVQAAVEVVKERMVQLDADKEDRVLRSFKTSVFVNPLLQRKLRSRGWQATKQIQKKFGVYLSFPPKEGQAEDEIILQGYEGKCAEAKAEIENLVGPIENAFLLTMPIDRRFIPRLLGSRGSNLQEIMEQFKVEIIIPQGEKEEDETVTVKIVGPEDDIYLCRNHLEVLQEDALLDMPAHGAKRDTDSQENTGGRNASNRQRAHFQLPDGEETVEGKEKKEKSPSGKGKKNVPGYVLKDAPWSGGAAGADMKNEKPDLGSSHDFPAFLPGSNGHGVIGSSWGPRS